MIDQNQKPQQDLTPAERRLLEQGVKQDRTRSLQEGVPDGSGAVRPAIRPSYPQWPTSEPGPRKKMAPEGMLPVNALRPEQVMEVGYNQETGEPGTQDQQRYMPPDEMKGRTSFDQLETPQDLPKKRKVRL